MKVEMNLDNDSNNLVQAPTNGDSEKLSPSTLSSLLGSKDRDYLLCSTAAAAETDQVINAAFLFCFYGWNHIW